MQNSRKYFDITLGNEDMKREEYFRNSEKVECSNFMCGFTGVISDCVCDEEKLVCPDCHSEVETC